ncbi:MAG: metallophosphoesterase [Clostridia bacterium]|nr:metallophosphoesterase [Clostridia bacterium]
MQINHITVHSPKITHPLTLAVCPDFHNGKAGPVLTACQGVDAILIVGDLVDRHDHCNQGYHNAVRFLNEAPDVAPTFYSIGNHERLLLRRAEYWPHVERSRVIVLDDRFVEFSDIVLGGLSSIGAGKEKKMHPQLLEGKTPFLRAMSEQEGFKLLMCHHPEYFQQHIAPFDIDLTLAGHAHGGQVRIGKQGIYSPGQWLFPKLTSGFYYQDRLLVSRGVTNATWAPRINCACEIIMLHLEPEETANA